MRDASDRDDRQRPGGPWTIQAAAKFLGIGYRHLWQMIQDGRVQSFRDGQRVMIQDAEIQRVAQHGI